MDPQSGDPPSKPFEGIKPPGYQFASLGDLLRQRAEEFGGQPVCTFIEDGSHLTYGDLDRQANRLASSLLRLGVRKGTHVGVMLPNVASFPIALFGLARLGAVMVPINVSYTSTELNYVLADTSAQFLIIHDALISVFDGIEPQPPLLDQTRLIVVGERKTDAAHHWGDLLSAEPARLIEFPSVERSDLMSLQYTSGTTGFPKACMLPHEHWITLGAVFAAIMEPYNVKRFLLWSPYYYMEGHWELICTIISGGTQVVARNMSASKFVDWIWKYEVHWCWFPQHVLRTQDARPTDTETPLRYVTSFGYSGASQREFVDRFKVKAQDAYGMTEIGIATLMPPQADHMVGSGSCGPCAPMRELRIVNEKEEDVAIGEIGELWVSGPDILLGYYNKPEANAASFRGRWFRTGDLFRQDENGYYYIVGRTKDMIRRSGENISANEVEATIRRLVEVEDVAVVAVPDTLRQEEVKAYILRKSGALGDQLTPQRILEECAKSLAPFKIPRFIEFVNDFPRTATGKIAKTSLKAAKPDPTIGSYDSAIGTVTVARRPSS